MADRSTNEIMEAAKDPQVRELLNSHLSGEVSRRSFFAKAGVLGLSMSGAAVLLAACTDDNGTAQGGTTQAAAREPLEDLPLRIKEAYESVEGLKAGYISAEFTNPFGLVQNRYYEEHAEGVGWDYQGFDGQLNGDVMNRLMDQLISQDYSVIYVNPIDAAGISPSIARAKQAGIITITTNLWSLEFPTFGTLVDFYEQGQVGAQWLVDDLPSGSSVVSLVGEQTSSAGVGRKTGAEETFEEAGFELLESSAEGGWSRQTAHDWFRGALRRFDRIDGVWAGNDEQALGCSLAADEAGRRNEMKIVGSDALREGQDAVRSGTIDATVGQNFETQGWIAGGVAEGHLRMGLTGSDLAGMYSVDVYPIDGSNVDDVWQSPE